MAHTLSLCLAKYNFCTGDLYSSLCTPVQWEHSNITSMNLINQSQLPILRRKIRNIHLQHIANSPVWTWQLWTLETCVQYMFYMICWIKYISYFDIALSSRLFLVLVLYHLWVLIHYLLPYQHQVTARVLRKHISLYLCDSTIFWLTIHYGSTKCVQYRWMC